MQRSSGQYTTPTARKVLTVEKNPILNRSAEEETPIGVEESSVEPETKVEEPKSKRAEFAALEKSRKLEAAANAKLAKATELAAAYESKDLDRIAKANGMSTTDYIRWVNTSALVKPTRADPTPQELIEQNEKAWRENITQEVELTRQERSENKKWGYVNKNILPHLVKDPAKYEFITDKGQDDICSQIYDFMNQHWLETGGKNGGEELNPIDLLDAAEDDLMADWKEKQEKASKFKKLQAKAAEKTIESVDADGNPVYKRISPGKSVPHPARTENDLLAQTLGGVDEDALAQSAPSNLVAGPSRGSAKSVRAATSTALNVGTTPKGSKFSREARLAAMSKGRDE